MFDPEAEQAGRAPFALEDRRMSERVFLDGTRETVKDDWRKEASEAAQGSQGPVQASASLPSGRRAVSVPAAGAAEGAWTGTTTFYRKDKSAASSTSIRWKTGALMLMAACASWGLASQKSEPIVHEVYHIVEDPGGIEHLVDCEVPTEKYYEELAKDMRARHPKASRFLLDHLNELEAFLDVSILSGFSYGVNKASVVVIRGSLLGHRVSREGATVEPERTAAIVDFSPIENQTQLRQFLGCTNWVRHYMSVAYPVAVKILGEYMKPGADFPEPGLGAEGRKSDGDKAIRAIKAMAKHSIDTAVMDEAGAIDGSRPLEQIADACGYAWGSTNVQMTEDLSHFKVLLMLARASPQLSRHGRR